MTETKEVQTSDILKHYFASSLIYGVIFLIISLTPIYNDTIQDNIFNYTTFFALYYIAYIIIAPIIFFAFKPKTILKSKNVKIIKYIIKQFRKTNSIQESIQKLEPTESEKQAMMTLFIKVFFGVNCVNILCNDYLPNMSYNLDFLKALFVNIRQYISEGYGIINGTAQYLVDTGDVWLKIILTITTLILAFSYLTDTTIFRNKIKSTDTTPLGVLSCIVCYYPLSIITSKFAVRSLDELMPINNTIVLGTINLLLILVHFGILLSVLRLGTKAGNLTNRGIVTGFPYNIVRHPEYSMQILYMIILTLPLCLHNQYSSYTKIIITCGVIFWIYLYYLRALTEERHLLKDEKYQEYVQKVRYRFIPKIF